MSTFLIILGILIIWGLCARASIIRERDYSLWQYYCIVGPDAWEDDKTSLIFISILSGPIGLLVCLLMDKTTGSKIREALKNKQYTRYDKLFYEKNIERPYYQKYKINPCDYCGKEDCGIDVYDFYAPCKVFQEDMKVKGITKRRI